MLQPKKNTHEEEGDDRTTGHLSHTNCGRHAVKMKPLEKGDTKVAFCIFLTTFSKLWAFSVLISDIVLKLFLFLSCFSTVIPTASTKGLYSLYDMGLNTWF